MKFTYSIPTKILFGPGSFNDLATTPLPGKKALIVITAGKSMRANGYLDRLIAMLDKQGIGHALFDKILPNPVLRHVHEGAALAREQGCDFVIGLGGGSSIDSAKSIAVMAKNPGDYWDYISGGSGKGQPLVNGALPIVAITTTAGTGTEADPWTVITKEDTNEKIGFGCAETFPVLSVVDPEMMLTIPAHLTAYQGFDALFHNTEVIMSNGVNILSETIALSAIENIANYLPRAVKDGNDLVAREHIAYGSTMAGIAMQLTSTTAQHSMEHAMSAYHHNLPHGAGLIMISVEFARYFIERHACDEQLIKMARVMGMPNADKPEDFITALQQLQKDCGVDDLKMSDYGIQKDECMTLAVNARETMGGLFLANPCPMSDEECAGIFEKAYR